MIHFWLNQKEKIWDKEKKINEEIVKLNQAEKNLNKLKKLKPKEYKEIPDIIIIML